MTEKLTARRQCGGRIAGGGSGKELGVVCVVLRVMLKFEVMGTRRRRTFRGSCNESDVEDFEGLLFGCRRPTEIGCCTLVQSIAMLSITRRSCDPQSVETFQLPGINMHQSRLARAGIQLLHFSP
jgi:hypothetical protein